MSNVKINLSTPPDQMWRVMDNEQAKAVRWYNRKIGGEKGEQKARDEAARRMLDDPKHPSQVVACHEWQSSSDKDVQNRWLCAEVVHHINHSVHATHTVQLCYYESSSSIGFFVTCRNNETINDACGTPVSDKHIMCFTSHFFLRYCDPDSRNLGVMHDDKKQVILDFFLKNRYGIMNQCMHVYKQKGQELVDICLSGCVGRGKVRRDGSDVVMYEFDTCLAWTMLHRVQYCELKPVLNAYKKHILDLMHRADNIASQTSKTETKAYLLDDLENDCLHKQIGYGPMFNKVMRVIKQLRGYIEDMLLAIPSEQRDHKDVYDYMHDVGFYVFEGKKLAGRGMKPSMSLDEFNDLSLETLIEICWHYHLPIEDDDVRTYWDHFINGDKNENKNDNDNNSKTVQTMNSVQIQELKRVLKENGVKNFNTLPQSFSLNSDRYLELAEPIYVISRLLPYVNSDNDRQKIMKAQKAWMNIVIEKQWCSALDSYIEEHGKTLVQMAVEYCIDNDLWDSPKGNTALRTHTADHFKGLEAIDEAVEYLKGEGFVDDTNKDESPKQDGYNTEVLDAQSASLVEFVDEAKKPNGYQNIIDNVQSSALDDVYTADLVPGAFEHMKELLAKSLFITRNLEQYVNACVNPSDLQKENVKLSARVRSLEAQIDVKTDEAKAAKEEAQKAKDERNEVQQNYTKKSQEYDRIVKVKREQADIIKQQGEEIKRLKADIEQGAQTLNKLKEQQKSSLTLPKRRILKESEILNLPLVGAKMISVLEPYLAKHDIIIDHNK